MLEEPEMICYRQMKWKEIDMNWTNLLSKDFEAIHSASYKVGRPTERLLRHHLPENVLRRCMNWQIQNGRPKMRFSQ